MELRTLGVCIRDTSNLISVSYGRVESTVKPVLSRHCIKRTPSIKRTVAEVPKFISLIYFKIMKPLLSRHLY